MLESTFQASAAGFRQHLPDLDTPRFQLAKTQSPYEYANHFNENRAPPWLHDLTQTWQKLFDESFRGLSVDGSVTPSLFQPRDEGLPITRIVSAAQSLLSQLSPQETTRLSFPLSSKAWRSWSNPEILLRPLGLRIEELPSATVSHILGLIEATLSPEGYAKALSAMRINGFLGQVCEVPRIMNELSYSFLLFGSPSENKAWGWSLYGHHLCLNVFLKGRQIVVSPTFIGAEPNVIDEGPYAGTEILREEMEEGLKLMYSLSPEQRVNAQVYEKLKDERMEIKGDLVTDRWNKDDQRHMCGAFRDNRDLPTQEGVCARDFSEESKRRVSAVVEEFIKYLPQDSRLEKLADLKRHLDETWFSWIGGWGENDAFYYRVQSPVIVVEFDHHSGVFLNNTEPAKFHTHTIVRTPNGGDYGNALREEGEKVP